MKSASNSVLPMINEMIDSEDSFDTCQELRHRTKTDAEKNLLISFLQEMRQLMHDAKGRSFEMIARKEDQKCDDVIDVKKLIEERNRFDCDFYTFYETKVNEENDVEQSMLLYLLCEEFCMLSDELQLTKDDKLNEHNANNLLEVTFVALELDRANKER